MHVDFDETAVSVDDIINAVVSGGYGASVAEKNKKRQTTKSTTKFQI